MCVVNHAWDSTWICIRVFFHSHLSNFIRSVCKVFNEIWRLYNYKIVPENFLQVFHNHLSSELKYDYQLINHICVFAGMGVRILLDIIRIVQPSRIVQINSDSQPMKNLPVLTEDFLLSEEGWTYEFDARRWVL